MIQCLANAQPTDLTGSSWVLIVIGTIIVIIVGLLMLLPLSLARKRLHPRFETIKLLAFLWAFLSALSLMYAAYSQMLFNAEYQQQLRSGYLDPQSAATPPDWPTPLPLRVFWILLGLLYLGLLVYAVSARPAAHSNTDSPKSAPHQ